MRGHPGRQGPPCALKGTGTQRSPLSAFQGLGPLREPDRWAGVVWGRKVRLALVWAPLRETDTWGVTAGRTRSTASEPKTSQSAPLDVPRPPAEIVHLVVGRCAA